MKHHLPFPHLKIKIPSLPSPNNNDNLTMEELIDQKITVKKINEISKNIWNKLLKKDDNYYRNMYDYILFNGYTDLKYTHRRQFDLNKRKNPLYISHIYANDNYVMKIFDYQCGTEQDFIIIKEMAFQMYASTLMKICNFKTPIIQKYGKFSVNIDESKTFGPNLEYDCVFYILMDKLKYITLHEKLQKLDIDSDNCEILSSKLNNLNKCLIDNGIYHNDYHIQNIMVSNNKSNDISKLDLGILDYGKSSNIQTEINEIEHNCDNLLRSKKMNEKIPKNYCPSQRKK